MYLKSVSEPFDTNTLFTGLKIGSSELGESMEEIGQWYIYPEWRGQFHPNKLRILHETAFLTHASLDGEWHGRHKKNT